MLDPQLVRELLSVVVPLVAEGCAFDALSSDGTRTRVAAVHQHRAEEQALASAARPSAPAMSVSVVVRETKVGEVVVWRPARLSAVEEALVVVTAKRIADAIELRSQPPPPPDASVLGDMVGHELRGPLQALGVGLELLRTRIRDAADEVGREWLLERISGLERATRRLRDVADRVTDMARPLPSAPTKEPVDLEVVVGDVLARLHDELAWASCSVTIVHETPGSFVGSWDRVHLETILGNLLSNAMKFGAKRPIVIALSAEEDDVVLRVRDHGPGIRSEDLEHLFERFYRGKTPTALPGLGLGLALVAQLVRAHGGQVSATSAPGDGATFTIRLPRGISACELRGPSRSHPAASSR